MSSSNSLQDSTMKRHGGEKHESSVVAKEAIGSSVVPRKRLFPSRKEIESIDIPSPDDLLKEMASCYIGGRKEFLAANSNEHGTNTQRPPHKETKDGMTADPRQQQQHLVVEERYRENHNRIRSEQFYETASPRYSPRSSYSGPSSASYQAPASRHQDRYDSYHPSDQEYSSRRRPSPPPRDAPSQQQQQRSRFEHDDYAPPRRDDCYQEDAVQSRYHRKASQPGYVKPQWEGHQEKMTNKTLAYTSARPIIEERPPQPQHEEISYPTRMMEVSPGLELPLYGAKETQQALRTGQMNQTECMICQVKLHCVDVAQFVLCPECMVVSPVSNSEEPAPGGLPAGVGFGMSEDEFLAFHRENSQRNSRRRPPIENSYGRPDDRPHQHYEYSSYDRPREYHPRHEQPPYDHYPHQRYEQDRRPYDRQYDRQYERHYERPAERRYERPYHGQHEPSYREREHEHGYEHDRPYDRQYDRPHDRRYERY